MNGSLSKNPPKNKTPQSLPIRKMPLSIENWKSFLKFLQLGCGLLGAVSNSILILLIIFCSPKNLGAYKYLMIYISVFETFYCLLDADVEPHTFAYGPAFTVFRSSKNTKSEKADGFYKLSVWCGTFGLSIALFAVHFIYRYGAADLAFRKKYLAGKKLLILFLVPLIYMVWWMAVVVTMFQPSPESDEFMRIPFLRRYDTQVEHIAYVIVWFYTPRGDLILPTFLAVVCNWFMMFTSFFCVVYFGIKCYLKITKALKTSKMSSYYTKSIQNQLFQALVMQTLIPFLLMYAPVGMLFFFPMLNMNVGFISSFVAATIAIYPAVDPLPTMFIVKNYRKTILCK
ncbi:hypothetical protein B9Z55_018265 [Caenorhabditis nigoni]|uniref:Serpentine receptor class r-10 n=1 Tax=Caenorhabditis nigoni TaxID=1611254 RepID=A0A2G5TDG7_9PELO|nr:hypothetical protein B9Z55_018265 [Caenorhabditis nigoni]